MTRVKYPLREVRRMEAEIAPLVDAYRTSESEQRPLDAASAGRLFSLSNSLWDYYVNHKIWKSLDDFSRAVSDIDPFGMFYHRDSVGMRALGIRQPELFARV